MKSKFTVSFAAACVSALLAVSTPLPAQADPGTQGFRLRLSGAMNGQFQIPKVQWARIQADPARTDATIGLFTDPPSPDLPFDLTMVLGNFRDVTLKPGRYPVLPLHRDMPAAAPDGKRGFMVIVPTGQHPPRAEYVTRSGEFIIDDVDGKHITGRFVLQLASTDGRHEIQAEGDFRRILD
ncbi:hypothetical protein [Ottowia caeni]|uniref:hypothetical protein n=1 Tax=Ottowia caeni TaxID=2870339 RepID=UPI003D71B0C2|nr:hypothetical protein [Ottowia caeni]